MTRLVGKYLRPQSTLTCFHTSLIPISCLFRDFCGLFRQKYIGIGTIRAYFEGFHRQTYSLLFLCGFQCLVDKLLGLLQRSLRDQSWNTTNSGKLLKIGIDLVNRREVLLCHQLLNST
ncbi:MAG: hypothetical protein DDT27_00328 [Dehalococcoidia bacterium]|nr:hypothetical protein [Chloroflexota bacterium]